MFKASGRCWQYLWFLPLPASQPSTHPLVSPRLPATKAPWVTWASFSGWVPRALWDAHLSSPSAALLLSHDLAICVLVGCSLNNRELHCHLSNICCLPRCGFQNTYIFASHTSIVLLTGGTGRCRNIDSCVPTSTPPPPGKHAALPQQRQDSS